MESTPRRRFLGLVGTTGALALAGCSDGSSGDGGDSGSDDSSSDGDGSSEDDGSMDGGEGDDMATDDGMESDEGETDDGETESTEENGDTDSSDSDSEGGSSGELSNTVTNEIDQIEVVEHGPTDEYEFDRVDGFIVEMTVRNAGDMEMKLEDYQIFLRALDADGNRIQANGTGTKPDLAEQTIAPGETLDYPLILIDMEESEFAAYEITISCPFGERPAYCG
jgi:hypothetical protein